MKSLQQLKDEVAAKAGYKNWYNLCFIWAGFNSQIQPHMDKVAKKYAEEALREFERRAIDRGAFTYEDFNSIISLINDLK